MSDLVNTYVKLVKGAGDKVGQAVAETVTESFASPEKKHSKEEDSTESGGYQTAFVLGITVYFIWLIIFSVGAGVQSYRYNLNANTGSALTAVYVLLAVIFPYFYYPFYTFFLCNSKGGQSGGRR